jgi:hypothetical protein
LVEVVVVVTTVAGADVVTVLVCAVVALVVPFDVVVFDVVGDFVVVTVFVCEEVLVVLVEVAAFASWEVAVDVVRDRDPDCDGVVRVAVLVREMLLLRLPLRLLDAAPDPHAAHKTTQVAASAALNAQCLPRLGGPGTTPLTDAAFGLGCSIVVISVSGGSLTVELSRLRMALRRTRASSDPGEDLGAARCLPRVRATATA